MLGYDAAVMEEVSNGITTPLIESTTVANVIGGVDYTLLLNGIFFMLTVMAAIGQICQAIPMFFFKFDEEEMEERLEEDRRQKELEREQELKEAQTVQA